MNPYVCFCVRPDVLVTLCTNIHLFPSMMKNSFCMHYGAKILIFKAIYVFSHHATCSRYRAKSDVGTHDHDES